MIKDIKQSLLTDIQQNGADAENQDVTLAKVKDFIEISAAERNQ